MLFFEELMWYRTASQTLTWPANCLWTSFKVDSDLQVWEWGLRAYISAYPQVTLTLQSRDYNLISLLLFNHPIVFNSCGPMVYSPPAPSVRGIL